VDPELKPEDSFGILKASVAFIAAKLQNFADLPEDERNELLKIYARPTKQLPKEWGSKYVSPYYNETYARWLKPDLDILLAQPEDKRRSIIYKHIVWKCSKRTIQTRISQAWLYIMDNLDPDKKYCKLRTMMEVRVQMDGLLINWKNSICKQQSFIDLSDSPLRGETFDVPEQKAKWRKDIDEWIESSKKGDKLEIDVSLTQEERDWLDEVYLKDLKTKFASIISSVRLELLLPFVLQTLTVR